MHKTLILELAFWTQRLGIGVWGAKTSFHLVFLSLPPFCLHPREAAAQCSPSEPALIWMLSTFGIGDAGVTPSFLGVTSGFEETKAHMVASWDLILELEEWRE